MLKLVTFLLNLLFLNLSFASNENVSSCKWENERKTPCLEITTFLPNTSKFSKSGLNKTVITKKKIQEVGAVDLIDVLKFVSDINVTQSGPKGQQASIFTRGTNSNHTLVMINGIPINDQSTTQGLHDFGVDFVQTIQQIEIYPGSSATNFGTNAIGGAINIILTGDYKDSISFISDDNVNYEILANKTFLYQETSLNLKLGTVKNETISAKGKISDEADGVKNYTANINYEKFLKNNYRFHNTTYLRQTKSKYDNSNTNQIGYEGINNMGSLQFGLEKQTKSTENKYILYYNVYDRKYDEKGVVDTYDSNVLGIKHDLSKTINKNLSFGFGSEYKYDWGYFENKGAYEASTKGNSDNLTFYSNLGWNIFDNTNVSIFTRNDKHKQSGKNTTFKLNLDQGFKDINLGISYMEGLRNPTLYEMFGTDNYGYSGNKNLKPEKSNNYEFYSNVFLNKFLSLNLRIFRSNIKNNIEYVDNKYQNDDDNVDLNQSGLNTKINFKSGAVDFSFFTSFLSSKKENNADQLRRPEKNYGLYFSKNIKNNYLGNLNLSLVHNHYGKHFDTHSSSFNTIEMDSTDIVDFTVSKKLKKSHLFMKITNLLDENFQRPHGYNQENRNIKIGFKY